MTDVDRWGDRGPIVLCVHGITSSRKSWARLGERLAGSARTFAYDQRGHGDRASTPGPMTLARSLADLEEVAAELPGPVAVLVGHSWGGAVALLGGRALRPKRTIAVDPMLRVAPGTFAADYVDDLRETLALAPEAKAAAIRAMYADAHPLDVAGKLHAMLPMTIEPLERLGTDNDADAGGWDLRDAVAAYPVPLLVLAAGIESVLSADDLAFLAERGGSNVEVRTFANEGHNLQRTAFDAFADIVERAIAD
ncbi:MAG: alpha/beta hydrolase [Candidatus Eremiobacteraeota bacterium]|nr:alpha/beta hydrolase [Candidatus Eremiobacteraeota bacterium]